MKNLITILALIISVTVFSQSRTGKGVMVNEKTKVESVSITVTTDSVEELNSTFQLKDIEKIISSNGKNGIFSFKIICNGKETPKALKSQVTYKVEGNSADTQSFLKNVEKIRTTAINYYKNKE